MQYDANPWARAAAANTAAMAGVDERAAFIMKTYVHLVGAIFAFVALETVIFAVGLDDVFMRVFASLPLPPRFSWLLILVLFMGAGYLARSFAANSTSPPTAYLGLGLYIAAEAVLFILPLHIAVNYSSPDVLPSAALVTLVVFGGLTGIVFLTRKDFSFLKGILGVAMLGAFATIICSMVFGFSLGVFFSGAMVVLASGYILYNTSNVLHHYRTDQHVGAALELFASIALLFWYILQLFMNRR